MSEVKLCLQKEVILVYKTRLRWVLCDIVQTSQRHSFKISCGSGYTNELNSFMPTRKLQPSCTDFHETCTGSIYVSAELAFLISTKWSINVESTDKLSSTPKVWPSLCHISQQSQSLNKVLWTPTVPSLIQIRQKIHKIITFNIQSWKLCLLLH
jgi:hypothetical protein